jgi:hypothetical protein
LENHLSKNRIVYNQQEWTEKLGNVGLTGIELRPARDRFHNCPGLEQVLLQQIHDRISPDVPFLYQEYAQLKNVELPQRSIFYSFPQSLQEKIEQETDDQRKLRRKWTGSEPSQSRCAGAGCGVKPWLRELSATDLCKKQKRFDDIPLTSSFKVVCYSASDEHWKENCPVTTEKPYTEHTSTLFISKLISFYCQGSSITSIYRV